MQRTEECPRCGVETEHSIDLTIVEETPDHETSHFAREPYRIAKCEECGHTRQTRMNKGAP